MQVTTIQQTDFEAIGYFRFKKMPSGSYLITNDAGRFHFFSAEDFRVFLAGRAKELGDYDDLVQKGFIKTPDYQRWMTSAYAARTHFIGQ